MSINKLLIPVILTIFLAQFCFSQQIVSKDFPIVDPCAEAVKVLSADYLNFQKELHALKLPPEEISKTLKWRRKLTERILASDRTCRIKPAFWSTENLFEEIKKSAPYLIFLLFKK